MSAASGHDGAATPPFSRLRRALGWPRRRPAVALSIYWPLAFLATHLPRFRLRRPRPFPDIIPADKLAHFAAYGLLAWLLMHALTRALGRPALAAALTVAIVAIYGIFDELTQPLIGRTADVEDYLADLLGCCAGLLAWFAGRWRSPGQDLRPTDGPLPS